VAAGLSWDGMVFAKPLPRSPLDGGSLDELDNPRWRCRRCTAVLRVDRAALHAQLAAADGDKPEVVLGADAARNPSRVW
jgi:hypothetical protein